MADSALTVEQRERLTELFNKHLFDINLIGDDLIFFAECEDSAFGTLDPELSGACLIEEIARVSLKAVISQAVEFAIQDSEDETEARNALFAMAGRLREEVTLIEYAALKIGASTLDEDEPATLLTYQERESMRALQREVERESESSAGGNGNGNGNGAEPH
jgi:hypothetical protein